MKSRFVDFPRQIEWVDVPGRLEATVTNGVGPLPFKVNKGKYLGIKNKLEIVEGDTSKTESLHEVEEGETSRTESLSSKVSIGEPTGSEIDVATFTNLESKPEVDEGETSRPKAGSPHSR